MSLSFYRLSHLISRMDGAELQLLLSSFRCSAEPAAENFLKNIAVRHEKNSISRTYLMLELNGPDGNIVKGFFTLAIKCLSLDERHCIPEDIFEQMNVDRKVAQAYLLGQLAKADGAEKGLGKIMMKRALGIFSNGHEMFGCKVIRLDCKDKLIGYYESCGFAFTGKNRDGSLNQMVAII